MDGCSLGHSDTRARWRERLKEERREGGKKGRGEEKGMRSQGRGRMKKVGVEHLPIMIPSTKNYKNKFILCHK